MLTPEQKRNLVHRSHDDWLTQGRDETVDEIYVENCRIISSNVPPEFHHGRAAFKAYGRYLRTAFPDIKITDEEVIVDGDLVSVYWTFEGTHTGMMGNIPPTGKHVYLTGFDIMRIQGDKILELYLEQDALGLMTQLGVIPAQ